MTAKKSFGQWLKQRRKALDLTREDLAGRIGCAAVTLRKIEADERRSSKQIAELLAAQLNIPHDEHSDFVRFARVETGESSAPWGTPFHPANNLSEQPTPLIGRDEEIVTIGKRLLRDESRLLTLVGPPGIGKTRLALQLAAQALDDFADGVFFVALAPVTDADLVPATIASTLGVPDVGPRTPLERLKSFLRDKQTLLILDNFEQILAAASPIAELLAHCYQLKILVTSRAPLRLRHERQIPVSPLALPDLAHLPDVESLSNYSAMRLFMERAQVVKPDFSLTEENAPSVAAICTRLDGLPLAIELISARVKLLPPAALLERLHGRLILQSDGLRDIEPRHRTLNAAIDWSYQLLNGDEQTLFRRLGVFVGGWTLEAAEVICLENLNLNMLDGLASLLDKNLVKQNLQADGEPRFTMLETIREYALARLTTSGELESLQHQHAAYFLKLAETTSMGFSELQLKLIWDQYEIEHANFRAVLTWSRTEVSGETGLRLALALTVFWRARGHLGEGRSWLSSLLMRHDTGRPDTTADPTLRARAISWLGVLEVFQGNLNAAQSRYEESLALFRELGDTAAIADVLGDYGMLFEARGDYERANALLQESLALSREAGNAALIRWQLFFLGTLAYIQDDGRQAEALFKESLVMMRAANNIWGIASVLSALAMLSLDEEDYDRAGVLLRESLIRLREMDERWQMIHTLEVFARLAAVRAQHSEDAQPLLLRSARIFGAAVLLRETYGSPVMPFQGCSYERGVATLRAQLDNAILEAAWAEGRAMTLDQAITYALET